MKKVGRQHTASATSLTTRNPTRHRFLLRSKPTLDRANGFYFQMENVGRIRIRAAR